MKSEPQVFRGITPAQFAMLREGARAEGIEINGPSGRASKLGVTVEWEYSEQMQELKIACLDAPFFLSKEDVNARLRSVVNKVLVR